MFWLVFILFVLVSVALPGVILLQEPKQSGLGSGLDGGGAVDFGNVRGTAGGLHRMTIYLGISWGVLAILLQLIGR